jgi:hypothetical protein
VNALAADAATSRPTTADAQVDFSHGKTGDFEAEIELVGAR